MKARYKSIIQSFIPLYFHFISHVSPSPSLLSRVQLIIASRRHNDVGVSHIQTTESSRQSNFVESQSVILFTTTVV